MLWVKPGIFIVGIKFNGLLKAIHPFFEFATFHQIDTHVVPTLLIIWLHKLTFFKLFQDLPHLGDELVGGRRGLPPGIFEARQRQTALSLFSQADHLVGQPRFDDGSGR